MELIQPTTALQLDTDAEERAAVPAAIGAMHAEPKVQSRLSPFGAHIESTITPHHASQLPTRLYKEVQEDTTYNPSLQSSPLTPPG
jgi:hypothetical protein